MTRSSCANRCTPCRGVAGLLAELRTAVPPYQHVRSIGEDMAAGELLLPEGHRLRAVDVAAAAAAGATSLLVRRAPLVAVLPTGDEVRPLGSDLQPGEIPDTNSLMLAAQAREAGCAAVVLPIEPDDPERIGRAVRAAAADADLVIVVAGSSAGATTTRPASWRRTAPSPSTVSPFDRDTRSSSVWSTALPWWAARDIPSRPP